jgi:rod shape-determining protein MreD
MLKIFLRNIWRFVLVILIQVLVFNNIQLNGYINPYFYVIFILLLPFETPNWALLVMAFFLGISIDVFVNTPGMHASASVLIAFLRPYVLRVLAPRDSYELGTFPRLYYYGFGWFLRYSLILVVIHHLFLFYIEIFRFSDFFTTLSRSLISSAFTIILIILSQFVIFRK